MSVVNDRKLFVGGLNWSTNSDTLRSAFEKYGKVEEGVTSRPIHPLREREKKKKSYSTTHPHRTVVRSSQGGPGWLGAVAGLRECDVHERERCAGGLQGDARGRARGPHPLR